MKIDFHVHTRHSPDSIIAPKDLARKSKMTGIIPAILDHNSIGAHGELRKLGARFIPGEEVSTDMGDLAGLYMSEQIPKGTPFAEALDRITEQGGLSYLPHMYDYRGGREGPPEKEAARADIIEVFNARCMDPVMNSKARMFAEKHGKPMAAGSDTHFLWEFGATYTETADFDLENPKELLKALDGARIVGKKAPLFVRGTTTLLKAGRKVSKALFLSRD